ncbi:MAG: metallophosphoesterase [Actinobacteria bacterium]|nr:metallophosphoesterase [Actinomycetota bacterium]
MSRRRFLRHAAWAGAAVAVTVSGGVLTSKALGHSDPAPVAEDFTFVQISDSHIGFTGAANPDVTKTFQGALDLVNSLPARPDFVVHTGDLTHYSTPEQFDQVKQMLSTLRTGQVLVIPGEHDSTDDAGQKYRQFFGAATQGDGWFSLDHRGVHFVGLVNTINLQKLGHLGRDQLTWLEQDLRGVKSDTPLVVFSHMPLFAMYPDWGWGTDDAAEALGHMRRFGSVTVLNGHVHQLMKKVEGNITFHTATTTAYPLPRPGDGPAPKPLVVAADQLHQALGIRQAHIVPGRHPLAIMDQHLP